MDFLREFRGDTNQPVNDETAGMSLPAAEWRPAAEKRLSLADLVVGSEGGQEGRVDSFLGPAELEAAASTAYGPTDGWEIDDDPGPGRSVPVPFSSPWVPWERRLSGRLPGLLPGEILLALAAAAVSLMVIALVALH
jgi:hypothetical protein